MLVAIGGGRLRTPFSAPEFFLRSMASLREAKRHPGNLFAEVWRDDGVLFSLSAWEDVPAMRDFARSGQHLKAMTATGRLTTGFRFHHYESDVMPDWSDALARWRDAAMPGGGKERLEIGAIPQ